MIIDWELDHVGIVVKKIDYAVKHYRRIGFELLNSLDSNISQINTVDTTFFKSCYVQNKAIRIRLIKPKSANNIFRKYLDSYGEGLNYIEFRVNNLQKEKARLMEMGIPAVHTLKRPDGTDMEIFFDTGKLGGVNIALCGEPTSFPTFQPSDEGWKLWHLGLIVKDIDKFADFYKLVGFKLLAPPFLGIPPQDVLARWVLYDQDSPYGKSPPASIKIWMCHCQNRQGTLLISANQVIDTGKSHFLELLNKRGQRSEGVQHIHFLVDDLPKELTNMIANGFQCIMTQKKADGTVFESYFDTREVGNVCMALWSGPPSVNATPIEPDTTDNKTESITYDFYKKDR